MNTEQYFSFNSAKSFFISIIQGHSLAVQRLGLGAFTAVAQGQSLVGKIPQAMQPNIDILFHFSLKFNSLISLPSIIMSTGETLQVK